MYRERRALESADENRRRRLVPRGRRRGVGAECEAGQRRVDLRGHGRFARDGREAVDARGRDARDRAGDLAPLDRILAARTDEQRVRLEAARAERTLESSREGDRAEDEEGDCRASARDEEEAPPLSPEVPDRVIEWKQADHARSASTMVRRVVAMAGAAAAATAVRTAAPTAPRAVATDGVNSM